MKIEITKHLPRMKTLLLAAVLLGAGTTASQAAEPDPETKVYWNGGKRGHIDGCPRLPKDAAERAKMPVTTYGKMIAGGGLLCSRCPGSTTQGKGNPGPGAGRPKADTPKTPAVEFDPGTKVYVDALWFRVHAEDCPSLILKDQKKTMTLEEADKAGYRIGQSGQSGRENCCLQGYRRKHPERKLTDETILAGNDEKRNVKHVAGCHRYWPDRTHRRRPLKDWVADGFVVCPHCIERGPSFATITDEEWAKLGSAQAFVAPEGWVPGPYSADQLPPAEEVEILIRETLAIPNGIQELQFTDPVATAENFVTMRFFFPVGNWLHFYKAYRSTGDDRLRDKLLESARHYNKLALEYPSVAQLKASDPEGMPFMYSMAAWARITLQLARKQSGAVGPKDIEEAEAFLKTMISVLKPTCEGDADLDPEMGIPRKLADDFRTRAFNRSMNGIGTMATIAVALEDLQAIKGTREYQASIDRYRKTVGEYVKNWFKEGHFSEFDGKRHFYYPYVAGKIREVDGEPILRRPEDAGHYSHTMQGALLVYESMPESGIDDAFMTAVANALYHNATTKIKRGGKMVISGHVESPVMSRVRAYGNNSGGHQYSPARDRFYMLQAFRDDMIDGLCASLSEERKSVANSEYDRRLATLHAQYLKAFRKDRTLIHLRPVK